VLKKTLLLLIGLALMVSVFAQQLTPTVIASGGSSSTKSSYYLAYTFGETAISTLKTQSYILTEGFHQSYLGTSYSGQNLITASPNPVTSKTDNKLILTFYNTEATSYMISIYKLNGCIVCSYNFSNLISGDTKEVDFTNICSGIYLVKINADNGKLQQTFKIEKI
jgi:hypothetical protein